MKTEKFDINGMTCSACVAHVEKSVRKLQGIDNVQVNLLSNNMIVSYEPNIIASQEICKAVENAGYKAVGAIDNTQKTDTLSGSPARAEMASLKLRWWFSALFLIPLLYISMGHMIGLTLPHFLHEASWFSLSQLLFSIPIVFLNRRYFSSGFRGMYKASPTMDSLIAIGASAGIIYSLVIIINVVFLKSTNPQIDIHDIYLESAATILTLVTLGKYLESRSKMRTTSALSKLIELTPKNALVLRNEVEQLIEIKDVVVNDLIIVKSGQQIPVDGEIHHGNGEIDESAITGESMPVYKTIGQQVISGTTNLSGYLIFKASRVGEDTTLAQIIQLVENAASSKAPISKLADKVSSIFVPIVIGIAVLATASWLLAGYSIGFSLSIGIAVLVISCPCALGLATPVAIMVGAGKGAELGLLIKNAEALELAHKVNTIVLDKTGTITEGKPHITDIYLSELITDYEFFNVVYSFEKLSEHVLAQAIVNDLETLKTEIVQVYQFENLPGKGICGVYNNDIFHIGNEKHNTENNVPIKSFTSKISALTRDGKTPVLVSKNRTIIGIIGLMDVIKADSKYAIEVLRAQNIEVIMLTGDTLQTAEFIANQLHLSNFIAGVQPQDKENEIEELQKQGKIVAMVGDGINDAPALTKADLGIAIGAGTEIAIDSADIVLMRSSLQDVVNMLQLSKKVMQNIRQNLFWAFFYNIVGIPIAAGVLYLNFGLKLNPMFAAAAMSFSSVTVVLNALRLLHFKPIHIQIKNSSIHHNNKINIMKLTDGFKLAFNLGSKNNESKVMQIAGMTCGHCSGRVEKALNNIQGVSATVDLANNTANISHSKNTSDEILRAAVENAGYEVISIKSV